MGLVMTLPSAFTYGSNSSVTILLDSLKGFFLLCSMVESMAYYCLRYRYLGTSPLTTSPSST